MGEKAIGRGRYRWQGVTTEVSRIKEHEDAAEISR